MNLFERAGTARPFVKWAGGKTQLLDEIQKSLPADIANRPRVYIEPFVGGGAVLFWILQAYPNIERAVIGDINKELVGAYRTIKEQPEELIAFLGNIQSEYLALDTDGRTDYFLRQRALFNTKKTEPLETTSLFIFLNKTCYNGLYRVNSKGGFNVPHGRYANPRILDADNLRAVSAVLQRVDILDGDFEQIALRAGANGASLYYLDPPYKPLTSSASFTSYAAGGFDDAAQIRLSNFCRRIDAEGAQFVASNSDPQGAEKMFFDRLYQGFLIRRVHATRAVNSNPNGRGGVSEIIISNVAEAQL